MCLGGFSTRRGAHNKHTFQDETMAVVHAGDRTIDSSVDKADINAVTNIHAAIDKAKRT